mmetsp:Transcript_13944/g.25975  ORF Transcript_13944/g.25975 Transcript_13944/m.25975 type:complete len:244 (-) Transcript_13944:236-967(-)
MTCSSLDNFQSFSKHCTMVLSLSRLKSLNEDDSNVHRSTGFGAGWLAARLGNTATSPRRAGSSSTQSATAVPCSKRSSEDSATFKTFTSCTSSAAGDSALTGAVWPTVLDRLNSSAGFSGTTLSGLPVAISFGMCNCRVGKSKAATTLSLPVPSLTARSTWNTTSIGSALGGKTREPTHLTIFPDSVLGMHSLSDAVWEKLILAAAFVLCRCLVATLPSNKRLWKISSVCVKIVGIVQPSMLK